MNLDKLKKMVKDNGVEFFDLKFGDLLGLWHHITLPIDELGPGLFTNGVGVDGSSLPGFSRIERGDMIMLPVAETAFIDPFFERPTLSMLGNIMEVGDKVLPYSRNPRRVAADAEAYLTKTIKGAKIILGPEFEFYIFDRVNFFQGPDTAFYDLGSSEAMWQAPDDGENLGYKIPSKKGYHIAPPMDRIYNLRSEICSMLAKVGVGLKYHHHEVGGGGQHEIEVQFAPLLEMADKSMLVKYFVKNQAFRVGKSATFMPKPLFNEPGSGLHVHQYIADAKGSIFYSKNGRANFSDIGLWYIGGMLKHADSLLAFTNPSTNSFKRLVPGFEAPIAGTYSVGNRTACIRIPGYQRDPKQMRFEFRPPDGTMNPYLAYAAMLMAGLDGIKHKIDPGTPFDRNLDEMKPEELADMHMLPTSLNKALNSLEEDHDYLMAGGVFTEDLLESWVKLKRKEVAEIRIRPTPYEFEMYYDL
ncbi:MAG: type I glutamate--ammonia ligase [candidate division Zixibacteria bacterium]|jgi:glutamine synthetase|nr:type I glutamate--ammonia ligase [candidate division Zixibacteria bacterium]